MKNSKAGPRRACKIACIWWIMRDPAMGDEIDDRESMIRALFPDSYLVTCAHVRASQRRNKMKKILSIVLSVLFIASIALAQTSSSSTTTETQTPAAKPAKKRGPVFRATRDQVKQAQSILKNRAFYTGEQTGKLDADTRAGLKKYQTAESLKVTGTLNKGTLVKMGIELTEKQKVM